MRVETKSEIGIATNVQVEVDTLDIEERVPAAATVRESGEVQWDDAAYDAKLQQRGDEFVAAGKRIRKWAEDAGLRVEYAGGPRDHKYEFVCDHAGIPYVVLSMSCFGYTTIDLSTLRKTPAFADEAIRKEIITRLNQIKGSRIGLDRVSLGPGVPLKLLLETAGMEQFQKTLTWMVDTIRKNDGQQVAAG